LNFVFFDQLATQLQLIRWRLPIDAEDKLARSDETFGFAMTFQAPFHIQRIFPPHERHAVHRTVTGSAADAFVHVNAMIEINELRQIVHPRPFDGLTRAKTSADRL
jgi:hypothetical protein